MIIKGIFIHIFFLNSSDDDNNAAAAAAVAVDMNELYTCVCERAGEQIRRNEELRCSAGTRMCAFLDYLHLFNLLLLLLLL